MVIQWLGHASFLVTTDDGTKIVTDPYKPDAFGGAIMYYPIDVQPDIVTVSHDHADHNYVDGLPNHFEVVSEAGTKTAKGIEFMGVASAHDREDGALRGYNLMFLMNVDGMKVCHLGDLGTELTDDQIEQLGPVDVLLIPVGGYYTIDADQATRTAEALSAKVVIPMHYKTDKVNLPIAPIDQFLAGKSNVRRADSTEFKITKDQLPSQPEIVVLDHAR